MEADLTRRKIVGGTERRDRGSLKLYPVTEQIYVLRRGGGGEQKDGILVCNLNKSMYLHFGGSEERGPTDTCKIND